jgi:hypothetical protein
LTKPDNAGQSITRRRFGRKEQRTHDGLTRDDLRGQSTHDDLRGQTTQDDMNGQATHEDVRGQPGRRQNVIHDWGLPEPCGSNEPVGPRFEFDRRRFESNPREQRTRRRASPTIGALNEDVALEVTATVLAKGGERSRRQQ